MGLREEIAAAQVRAGEEAVLRDLERKGLVKRNRSSVLTLDEAAAGMRALAELHRVCLAMDLERQDDRPTDEEYQAAMSAAAHALEDWPKNREPNARVTGTPPEADDDDEVTGQRWADG